MSEAHVNTVGVSAVFATAADMTRCLVMSVMGEEISDSVKGEVVLPDIILENAMQVFKNGIDQLGVKS